MVRKEEGEGAARAFSICGLAYVGPVHARARFQPVRGFLDCEGVVQKQLYPVRSLENENGVLHAKEMYVRLRDERRICLVELIDANRKKK